jgi:uncharacterized membrane protein required for colicin V production
MNWMDLTVVGALAGGLLFGAQRGILRQSALMIGFYVSLVLAARYHASAVSLLIDYLPRADPSLASAYILAGLTVGGTLVLAGLPQFAYGGGRLTGAPMLDRLAGAGLGAAWSWAVLAFAGTVLIYGVSFGWGAQEPLRQQIVAQLAESQLSAIVRTTLPALRDLIAPWLPGGLPAPFSA